MSSPPVPDFDEPRLAEAVERLPAEAIDRLPFGAIRLDTSGVVQFYSRAEARLSGYGTRKALGLHFFTQMAPCMDNPEFRGRVERALAAGTLDIELNWYGDFSDPDRELRVRIQSAAGGGAWIFMKRES